MEAQEGRRAKRSEARTVNKGTALCEIRRRSGSQETAPATCPRMPLSKARGPKKCRGDRQGRLS